MPARSSLLLTTETVCCPVAIAGSFGRAGTD